MQLSFSKATLANRLETLKGLVDPVPFFHETSGWTQIKADEQGFSKTYFERVFEVVQENIQNWLSLDFEEAKKSLEQKRVDLHEAKKAALENSQSINEDYIELRNLLSDDDSFDEVGFSHKLEELISKMDRFSEVACFNFQPLIDKLKKWKKNREDKNLVLIEFPNVVPGHDEITFHIGVEGVDQETFGSEFNEKYQKLRKEGNSVAFQELKELFNSVELHIAPCTFKKECPSLLRELDKWIRKQQAEDAVLEELPESIPNFDGNIETAFKDLSEEKAMEFVFGDKECLEQCFKTLKGRYAAGALERSALRVLDLHRLFTLIFRDQASAMDETPGKEICLSSEDENLVDPSHPYYSIAEKNQVVFSGINSVAQTILSRKDLISTVASPLSDCKLWSNREISLIADCWKSGGGVLQRLLSTIKMIVQVYIHFPAALNFWKNKANGCEDHEIKGKLELFAKGYDEFPSLDKKFCWITQAAGKQEGINVSMHRVLQEILDPQKKAFDIDDFKILAGSDYVTFEEMDNMRRWVAQNVNPVNEAMGQLQDFFVNATEYTLGLIPKNQKAPLGEFEEKARAVYDACKTFEVGFAKAFPEPSLV